MTLTRLPGVYFTEVVDEIPLSNKEGYIPLFIIQTSTEIADLDGKLTFWDNLQAFKRVANVTGTAAALTVMTQAYNEEPFANFYVYSVKTDTSAGFQEILTSCASKTEIRDVIYIESTKSSNSNTIAQKITALKTAVENNFEKGCPRNIFIVPYATIKNAIEDAENVLPKTTCISQLTTLTTGLNSGRISIVIPDLKVAGAIVGKTIARAYDEEIGYTQFNTSIEELTFDFTDEEMLSLINMGVLLVCPERFGGAWNYRIALGVTTSISSGAADEYLICRSIADELLRDVRVACENEIKNKEVAGTIKFLQSDINKIINDYLTAGVVESGTALTVRESSTNYILNVSGTVVPIGSILAINVETTITSL